MSTLRETAPDTATAGQAERGAGAFVRPAITGVEIWAVALIVAIGAFLRLALLDYAQLRMDDVTLWGIAGEIAQHPQILSRGLPASMAGFSNGPFQAYLLLPAALLADNPFAAYIVVALWNVLGLVLFWRFARNYWGPRLAWLAGALYAVSPFAVVFSRRLLGNDLLAPLTVLLIWSLCDLGRYGRRRDSILPFLWLAIAIQVYVAALPHVVLAALGLALGYRRLRPLHAAAGVTLFSVLTGPYLFGTILPNLGKVASPFGSSSEQVQLDGTSISYLFHSVSSEGYQAFASNAGQLLDATGGWAGAITLVAEALLAIGLVGMLAAAVRHFRAGIPAGHLLSGGFPAATPYVLILAAILLPAALLVRHSATVYVYYLFTSFPFPFLAVAMGAAAVERILRARTVNWHRARRVFGVSAFAIVGLIAGTHLFLALPFFAAIQEYWPKGDYGVPLRYTLAAADQVRQLAKERDFDSAIVAGIENRDDVIVRLLQRDVPAVSFVNLGTTFVVPAVESGSVLYVLPGGDGSPGDEWSRGLGGAELASLAVPGHGLRYSFRSLAPPQIEALAGRVAASPVRAQPAQVGDYLAFLGYDPPAPVPGGERLRVKTYWQVLKQPLKDISVFGHLIGNMGSAWGQFDGLSYPVERWRAGDVFLETLDIPVPFGAPPVDFTIEAGAYYRDSGQRLPVKSGPVTDDRLRLGPARVLRSSESGAVPGRPVGARFGDSISLVSFDVDNASPSPGDRVRLTLYWRSLAPSAVDYTVFNHLVGPDDRPAAQADGPPAFGGYPTAAWRPGDLIRDVHEFVLPDNIQPGRYWLLTGLYVPPSGPRLAPAAGDRSLLERLGVWLERRAPYQAGQRVDGDHVVLTAVDVKSVAR